MGFTHRITVFTPTYNRGYIISRLYYSLRKQIFTDFEWLIVDDGSHDNTEVLVRKWMTEANDFQIRYFKQKNGGKCRAINKALDLADGELFFVVDSDDYLTSDALVKINSWFYDIAHESGIKGVVANRGYSETETLNYCFKESYRDMSLLDMYEIPNERNVIGNGERALVFYTEFHQKYKYPEFENENFMTEAVVWNRMAHDGYKMRFYNDIIWVFEYKEDGLTRVGTKIFLDNPRGYGLCLKEKADFLNWSIWKKMKMYYTFTCDMESHYTTEKIAQCIGTNVTVIHFCKILHKVRLLIK